MERACPFGQCDGSGILIDEATREASFCRCRAQVIAQTRARGLSAVIPKKYRGVAFDRPPVTEIYPSVVDQVRRFTRNIATQLDDGRGLWLFGKTGTGKTTLAMLVSKAALDAGRTVAIYSMPRLLTEIRMTFEDGSDSTQAQLLDRLAEVDLLHLDDVGAEKTSPWVLEQLYSIVNTRYEEERSVIFTTNLLSEEELAEQIGTRTVSRLKEMCVPLPLGGEDGRRARFEVA